MAEIKVTELQRNLPSYLARVKRGERLQIISRGEVIAEIVPPAPSESDARAARLRLRGSLQGWADPAAPAIDSQWDMDR